MSRHAMVRTRGAALLTAMLLVMLVATITASALWQQQRAIDTESAERQAIQARWMLQGATDWARLILREDGKGSSADDLTEPWAIALQPAPLHQLLTNYLPNQKDIVLPPATVAGHIEDAQAQYNLHNLVAGHLLSPEHVLIVQRLWRHLALPSNELGIVLLQLRQAISTGDEQARIKPLLPQSLDDLTAWGVRDATVRTLRPYATWLPEKTGINVNTAPPVVLAAVLNLDPSKTQQVAQLRSRKPFKSLTALQEATGISASHAATYSAVGTRYFSVHAQLIMDDLRTEQITLLRRDGDVVQVVRVDYQAPDKRQSP